MRKMCYFVFAPFNRALHIQDVVYLYYLNVNVEVGEDGYKLEGELPKFMEKYS